MIKVIGDATEGTPLDTDTGTRTNGKMAERLVGGGGLSPRWKIYNYFLPSVPSFHEHLTPKIRKFATLNWSKFEEVYGERYFL